MKAFRVVWGENATGTGRGVFVEIDGAQVWGWLPHIDGPLSEDARTLVDALARHQDPAPEGSETIG